MKTSRFLGIGSSAIGFALAMAALLPIAAHASVSLSLQSLYPASSVSIGTPVSFTVVTNGFTNPSYTINDSFSSPNGYSTSISNSNINSSGNFSWTPNSNDVGTHNLTIYVSDSYGNSGSVTEQLVVSSSSTGTPTSPTVEVQGLTPTGTIIVGAQVNFTAAVFGFSSPTFTVSDSFPGSNISNADINSSGYFSWTPYANQIGAHTISVTATDSYGHTASASQQINVSSSGLTIGSIVPGTTVNTGTQLSFTVVPVGLTNPIYSANDSYNGTSAVSIGSITSAGVFTWTPTAYQAGTHVIAVSASDSFGHDASATTTIQVNQGPSLTMTAPEPNSSVALGATVSFQVFPTGLNTSTFTVSDTFTPYASGESPSLTTVTSGDISSSGSFVWVPTANDLGTHVIKVTAADNYGNTATGSVSIYVAPATGESVPTYTTPAPTTTTTTVPASTASPTTSTTPAPVTSTPTSASASPGYDFTTALSAGSSGATVTALQEFLTAQGLYSGPITGYYGSLTTIAVQTFQAAHGIQTLGTVGPATRAELNLLDGAGSGSGTTANASATATAGNSTASLYKFNNPLDVGATGTDVTELQERLTSEGFYSGPITGYYGSLTVAAVKKFQADHGLSQLGNVGPATRGLLNSGI